MQAVIPGGGFLGPAPRYIAGEFHIRYVLGFGFNVRSWPERHSLGTALYSVTRTNDLTCETDTTGRQHISLRQIGTQRADAVSTIVKEQASSTHNRAVSIIRGGMTQGRVAKELGVSIRTIRSWVFRVRAGQPPENSRVGLMGCPVSNRARLPE